MYGHSPPKSRSHSKRRSHSKSRSGSPHRHAQRYSHYNRGPYSYSHSHSHTHHPVRNNYNVSRFQSTYGPHARQPYRANRGRYNGNRRSYPFDPTKYARYTPPTTCKSQDCSCTTEGCTEHECQQEGYEQEANKYECSGEECEEQRELPKYSMYDRFHSLLNRHKKYETSDLYAQPSSYANTYGESQTADDSYVTSQATYETQTPEVNYSLLDQRIEQYIPEVVEEVEEPVTYEQTVITYGGDQEEEYTPEEVTIETTPITHVEPEDDTYVEAEVDTHVEPEVDTYVEAEVDEPVVDTYSEPIVDEAAVQGYTDTVATEDLGLFDYAETTPEVQMYTAGTIAEPEIAEDDWATLGSQTDTYAYVNSLSTATDAEAAPVEGLLSADDYLASMGYAVSEPVAVEAEPVVVEAEPV